MKKSIETKKLLLDTVKSLLTHTSDIKVKDITDTAFVNIAAVNYHFDDKDKLVDLSMNEIFVDFKYEINNFDSSSFESQTEASSNFADLIFNFVRSHTGFFKRIATTGEQGFEYFHEAEFLSIVSRQLHSLGIKAEGEKVASIFISLLAQIVFAVLYFPSEISHLENSEFLGAYVAHIKNTLTQG